VDQQIDYLQAVIQPNWRTLEIGCGLGLLSQWLSRRGCTVVGVEPDRQQADYARRRGGFEVINNRFEETDFPLGFDFFAASHVIEHFPEPLSFLEKIRSLAAPQALLFLETPNILAPKVGPGRVFSLAHNFYFSPQTLGASLAKTGWRVEKIRVYRRDSFLVLARADQPREQISDPSHAQEVWQAIRRHRLTYYLSLSFLLRKIPLWRRWWMYRYTDYTWSFPQQE
jgi:SAM-dependent methyltransferase